ncbi:hypothetical protein D3C77_315110 [compost metagenome]
MAQGPGSNGCDQHAQRRGDQGAPEEGGRPAEECPVEVTAQTTANQPLADLAGAVGQGNLQIEADTGDGCDQQRAEQPGIGLFQALPQAGHDDTQRADQRQPAPADTTVVGDGNAIAQQVFEQRRYAQHHRQYPQALCGSDLTEHRTVAGTEVDHLPGAARHAGKKRRSAVFTGTAQQPDANDAGDAGNQCAAEDQTEIARHLLDHRRGEVQADADADDPLPAFTPAGNFAQLPGRQAAHQDDRQQRADHPWQRPADLAGEIAACQTDQPCGPEQLRGPLRHRPGRDAGGCACARCAAVEMPASPQSASRPSC